MWTPHSSTPVRVVTSAAALATALLAGPFATIALAAPSAASVPAPRAAASAPSAVRAAAATPPKDTRTGRRLDQPYTVGGIIVVSKAHRVSSRYRPAWARRPYGLRPDVYAAATRLLRAARQKKLTLTIRSGYRSYATQAASYRRAVARYPRAYADTYYAPAGASEHQTGLAFDVWDGRHRGDAFARLPQSAWIARNAHTFGFIVRYPKGTQKITGIGWEPWHLRYVGTAVAARFGPNSKMTLEQYLGLA